MLEVRDLQVAYGPAWALWGVTLDMNPGELLAEGSAADVMQRPEVMTAYLGRPHLEPAHA